MLNYFRETQDARIATLGRRVYNYASSAVILAVMAFVFVGLAPAWIFWTAFAVSCLLDAFLTRKWLRADALRDYRARQPQ